MERRRLGRSGPEIPVVMFGAWAVGGWYWGGSDDEQAVAAIRAAFDEGVNAIDTAPIYGCGRSEEVVGRAIRDLPRRELVIATKCGLRWDCAAGEKYFQIAPGDGMTYQVYRNLRRQSIIEECGRSLKRLGIDVIDLYQCHWPDKTTALDETMEAMNELLAKGMIRAVGVSNFTVEMMQKCLALGPLASDQPRYSLLDRAIEKDVLPYTRKNGIGLIVYSPIAQGLLSGKVQPEREFPAGDWRVKNPLFSAENRRRILAALDEIRPIAEAHGVTLANLTARWLLEQEGVTAAIIGARNEAQARENARVGEFRLDAGETAKIRSVFENFRPAT